jgi:hypothetical protein
VDRLTFCEKRLKLEQRIAAVEKNERIFFVGNARIVGNIIKNA